MCNKTLQLTPELYDYILSVSLRETEIMQELRKETTKLPSHEMQISPEQGQFMALLIKLMRAQKAIELGTYTGYSALAVALALPTNGKLITCDINTEWTNAAKQFWQKAEVANKIDLRIAPALETLDHLLAQGEAGTFDFAFIDADKENYPHYYERVFKLMRIGGLITIDNVLKDGRVLETKPKSEAVRAIKSLNEQLHHDPRIFLSMLPISDGLSLAYKLSD